MKPFPSLQWLQLINVPPSTIEDFHVLQRNLIRLEVVNAGVPRLCDLFGRPTKTTCRRLRRFRRSYYSNSQSTDVDVFHNTPVSYVLPLNDFLEAKGGSQVNLLWTNLMYLRIQNCGLTHLDSSLYLLPFIQQLDCSQNLISRFNYLKRCLNLRIVNMSHNLINNARNIGDALSNIQRLNLSHNKVNSLIGLENLIFLEKLDISYNEISFVDEVRHLVLLKYLEEIEMKGNPIATLYANSDAGGAKSHRHPAWEVLLQQQERVYHRVSESNNTSMLHDVNRLRRGSGALYRLMVFAYFYPELSCNGHYRNRDMICLDGEEISAIENEIVK